MKARETVSTDAAERVAGSGRAAHRLETVSRAYGLGARLRLPRDTARLGTAFHWRDGLADLLAAVTRPPPAQS